MKLQFSILFFLLFTGFIFSQNVSPYLDTANELLVRKKLSSKLPDVFDDEKFNEIEESIVIGQSWKNDVRIILFVVLNSGYNLSNEIKDKIKKAVRSQASPRHVPSKIIAVSEIPKTKNGKLVELAVKQTIEGEKIKNLEALANPDSLKQFKKIKELNE